MSTGYGTSRAYWNRLFATLPVPNPREPFSNAIIEDALDWLAKQSSAIIDFGCGSGRALLRSLVLGAKRGVGVDFSRAAVSVARRTARAGGLQDRATFVCGSAPVLSRFAGDSFDSGILFNIVDNLVPDDALRVLEEFHRVIRHRGKVLLKLNQFVRPSELVGKFGAKSVSEMLYLEPTGLYFWDLDNQSVRRMLGPLFMIERVLKVPLGRPGQFNRLYYLRKP